MGGKKSVKKTKQPVADADDWQQWSKAEFDDWETKKPHYGYDEQESLSPLERGLQFQDAQQRWDSLMDYRMSAGTMATGFNPWRHTMVVCGRPVQVLNSH